LNELSNNIKYYDVDRNINNKQIENKNSTMIITDLKEERKKN
jgi:hypothetical protein